MGLLTIMGGSARGTTLKRERARGGAQCIVQAYIIIVLIVLLMKKKKKEKKKMIHSRADGNK